VQYGSTNDVLVALMWYLVAHIEDARVWPTDKLWFMYFTIIVQLLPHDKTRHDFKVWNLSYSR
jgi:hypothetical protein